MKEEWESDLTHDQACSCYLRDILWLTYINSPKGSTKFTKNAYVGQYLPIYTAREEAPPLFEKCISISVLIFSCLMNADGA